MAENKGYGFQNLQATANPQVEWPPKIEKGVPLEAGIGRNWDFLKTMELHDSFMVTEEKIAAMACKVARKHGMTCSRAKVAGGYRVWRVG